MGLQCRRTEYPAKSRGIRSQLYALPLKGSLLYLVRKPKISAIERTLESLDTAYELAQLHKMLVLEMAAVALESAPSLLCYVYKGPANTQDFDNTSCEVSTRV